MIFIKLKTENMPIYKPLISKNCNVVCNPFYNRYIIFSLFLFSVNKKAKKKNQDKHNFL